MKLWNRYRVTINLACFSELVFKNFNEKAVIRENGITAFFVYRP